jgi:hypothetical protein
VQALKSYLSLECSSAQDATVQTKCERLLVKISKRWKLEKYGFLTQVDGVPKKTPEFEQAWREKRPAWIQEMHQGSTTGLYEFGANTTAANTAATNDTVAEGIAASIPFHVTESLQTLMSKGESGSGTVNPGRSVGRLVFDAFTLCDVEDVDGFTRAASSHEGMAGMDW